MNKFAMLLKMFHIKIKVVYLLAQYDRKKTIYVM